MAQTFTDVYPQIKQPVAGVAETVDDFSQSVPGGIKMPKKCGFVVFSKIIFYGTYQHFAWLCTKSTNIVAPHDAISGIKSFIIGIFNDLLICCAL
ncbi:hypothetical protein HB779_22465 (plasmid) [Phyllobacterium sp. 628]|uniref:hypothetical protein n=1 Tax=Phyllobacterium sp. 628 TaxID=2718938 RepID=UPI001662397A|nr:hypothetical protein [Phyllobacterium sp. 628]QND54658.1 hypothetical protein HB779_22465 [Phyllobacterium sp. 628]